MSQTHLLSKKIAIITGASKGIGAAIAKEYAKHGASVVVNYAQSAADADKVVSEIVANGGRAIAVKANVVSKDEVAHLFEATEKAFGYADVLVNNAGIYQMHPIEELDIEQYHKQYDTNVLGTLLTTQAALKHFQHHVKETTSIINVSSIVSQIGFANAAIYAGTKGAVNALTKSLAQELGPKGIRVNAILPGATETEGVHSAGFMSEEFQNHVTQRTALARFAKADDIAGLAVFLASDLSRWITGELISAGGGYQ